MLPLTMYIKLLIIKHAYRNSSKLVYTLTLSIHLPFFSTSRTSKRQRLCLTVSYIFKDRGLNQAKTERYRIPREVFGTNTRATEKSPCLFSE